MNPFPEILPAAWMGYAPDPKRFCVVRICAWCPDKKAADELALSSGFEITHSICPGCYQVQQSQKIPNF
jgi:hypothetical protein